MEQTCPPAWIFLEETWPDRWPIAADWPGICLDIDGQQVDFSGTEFREKKQRTHLFEGWTERTATAHLPGGRILNVHSKQFAHLNEEGSSALRFSLTPLNFSGKIGLAAQFDFSEICREKVENEPFFVETNRESDFDSAAILLETADGQQRMAAAFRFTIYQDGEEIDFSSGPFSEANGCIGNRVEIEAEPMQETVLFRFDAVFFEKKKSRSRIFEQTVISVNRLFVRGFQQLLQEQSVAWSQIWRSAELANFSPSTAAQPLFMNVWRLLDGWLQADFFSKKWAGFSHEEAAALLFLYENASPGFMRKTLIDRHLRSSKAFQSPVFGFVVGQYLTRAGFPKNFLEKGIEVGITACRFWSESGEKVPPVLMEKNLENLSKAIAAAKKTDPEMWRSLMIRFRFEEKRELRKWSEAR